MNLIDTHAHLTFEKYDEDRDKVLDRAWKAGLTRIVLMGAGNSMSGNQPAIELAEKDPRLFVAVGIHPHDVSDMDEGWLSRLEAYAAHSKVCAIGETGLDFYRHKAPKEQQEKWFRRQIELAHQLELPIVVHTRNAAEETLRLLKEVGPTKRGGVFHSFSEDVVFAERVFKLGFLISITGVVTFKNAPELQAVVKELPLERIMIETDSPYLSPHPLRGQRNEPAHVKYVVEKIAQLKGIPPEEVAQATTENARRLFRI